MSSNFQVIYFRPGCAVNIDAEERLVAACKPYRIDADTFIIIVNDLYKLGSRAGSGKYRIKMQGICRGGKKGGRIICEGLLSASQKDKGKQHHEPGNT